MSVPRAPKSVSRCILNTDHRHAPECRRHQLPCRRRHRGCDVAASMLAAARPAVRIHPLAAWQGGCLHDVPSLRVCAGDRTKNAGRWRLGRAAGQSGWGTSSSSPRPVPSPLCLSKRCCNPTRLMAISAPLQLEKGLVAGAWNTLVGTCGSTAWEAGWGAAMPRSGQFADLID